MEMLGWRIGLARDGTGSSRFGIAKTFCKRTRHLVMWWSDKQVVLAQLKGQFFILEPCRLFVPVGG